MPNWLNKRIVKLFIATSNTSLLYRNRDFYNFVNGLWCPSTKSNTKLSTFEVGSAHPLSCLGYAHACYEE